MKSQDYRLGAWAGNQDKVDETLLDNPDYASGVEEGLRLADIGLSVEKPINNLCPNCGKVGVKYGFAPTNGGKQRFGCKPCKTRWTEKQ